MPIARSWVCRRAQRRPGEDLAVRRETMRQTAERREALTSVLRPKGIIYRDPFVETLLKHAVDLCVQHDVRALRCHTGGGFAHGEERLIEVPGVTTETAYAIVLHEIAHIVAVDADARQFRSVVADVGGRSSLIAPELRPARGSGRPRTRSSGLPKCRSGCLVAPVLREDVRDGGGADAHGGRLPRGGATDPGSAADVRRSRSAMRRDCRRNRMTQDPFGGEPTAVLKSGVRVFACIKDIIEEICSGAVTPFG